MWDRQSTSGGRVPGRSVRPLARPARPAGPRPRRFVHRLTGVKPGDPRPEARAPGPGLEIPFPGSVPTSRPQPLPPNWPELSDEALLDVRLADLPVRIEGTLAGRIAQLREELDARGL